MNAIHYLCLSGLGSKPILRNGTGHRVGIPPRRPLLRRTASRSKACLRPAITIFRNPVGRSCRRCTHMQCDILRTVGEQCHGLNNRVRRCRTRELFDAFRWQESFEVAKSWRSQGGGVSGDEKEKSWACGLSRPPRACNAERRTYSSAKDSSPTKDSRSSYSA